MDAVDWIVKALRGIAHSSTIRALFRMSQPRYVDTTDECRSAWRIPSAYLKSAETCRNHSKPTLRPTMSNYTNLITLPFWLAKTLESSEHWDPVAENTRHQVQSVIDVIYVLRQRGTCCNTPVLGICDTQSCCLCQIWGWKPWDISWNSDDDSLAWLSSLELQLLQLSQPQNESKRKNILRTCVMVQTVKPWSPIPSAAGKANAS